MMDGTKIVQQIIQTVISSNGSFDLHYITHILCGDDIAYLKPEHKYMPTFGCLSQYSPSEIRGLLKYLLQRNYISTKRSEFNQEGAFVCNEMSLEILKGAKKISIRRLKETKLPLIEEGSGADPNTTSFLASQSIPGFLKTDVI